MANKVWFITGSSTGLGRAIVKAALEAGDFVVAASSNAKDVQDFIEGYPGLAKSVTVDVIHYDQIKAAIDFAIKTFGKIDVLVNNDAISYLGTIEESEENEIRRMFEVNFWGLSETTRNILPIMRSQRGGHIINISSIGGLKSFPSLAYYHATKYAVDGFSEALFKEVLSLNIKVTIVAAGNSITDWTGRSAKNSPQRIQDYDQIVESTKELIGKTSGNQKGDFALAAKAILKITDVAKPPLRLLLGTDALEGAREKLAEQASDYSAWEDITLGSEY